MRGKSTSRKLRKSRAKRRAQGMSQHLATKRAGGREEQLPLSATRSSRAESSVTKTDQAGRYRHVPSDLRRAVTIFGVLVLLYIVLHIFLR